MKTKLGAVELIELGRASKRVCASAVKKGKRWVVRTSDAGSGAPRNWIEAPCTRTKVRSKARSFLTRSIAEAHARKCGIMLCRKGT